MLYHFCVFLRIFIRKRKITFRYKEFEHFIVSVVVSKSIIFVQIGFVSTHVLQISYTACHRKTQKQTPSLLFSSDPPSPNFLCYLNDMEKNNPFHVPSQTHQGFYIIIIFRIGAKAHQTIYYSIFTRFSIICIHFIFSQRKQADRGRQQTKLLVYVFIKTFIVYIYMYVATMTTTQLGVY